MGGRITLKNIADICQVSVNTVSRALRGDTRLSSETISRVQKTARDLGYIQNIGASALRSERSNAIAVVMEDIQNPHYTELLVQLAVILRSHNYHLIIFTPQFEDEYGIDIINLAISHSIDGMLFFPYMANEDVIQPVLKNRIPMVLIDREIQNVTNDVVRLDDYTGGYLAGKKLTELGHKKFLYLAGPLNNGSQPLRQSGFYKALQEAGVNLDDVRVIHSKDILRAIQNQTVMDLILPVNYTAVFSFNDQIAYSVMLALQQNGYRIPQDISFIGFDHLRQSIPYLPALSSISYQSKESMAQKTVDMLLSRIKNYSQPPRVCVLPVALYGEETIGPAPQQTQ